MSVLAHVKWVLATQMTERSLVKGAPSCTLHSECSKTSPTFDHTVRLEGDRDFCCFMLESRGCKVSNKPTHILQHQRETEQYHGENFKVFMFVAPPHKQSQHSVTLAAKVARASSVRIHEYRHQTTKANFKRE